MDRIDFQCNVCGATNNNVAPGQFGREDASCSNCSSSVRLRGVVHHLSIGLFRASMPIADFPKRVDISGIGLSDWQGYSEKLAEKLAYTNTFYHKEPFLDITAPLIERSGTLDFLISTDVFEHVPPPVERAFFGAASLLKPDGLLILTVPFTDVPTTVEHYPDLHQFQVVQFYKDFVLVNRDHEGRLSVRDQLVFHGGPGSTLEMRVFSRSDTVEMLVSSGFYDIHVHESAVPAWGIFPPHHHGLPITARKR